MSLRPYRRILTVLGMAILVAATPGCASDQPQKSSVDPDPANPTAQYDLVKNARGVDGFYMTSAGKIVVLTKTDEATEIVQDNKLQAKRVTFGASDLDRINSRIVRELIDHPDASVKSSGVELETGAVVVQVSKGSQSPYVQSLAKRPGVRVVPIDATPSPAP